MKIALSQLGPRLLGKTAGRRDYARICELLTQASEGDFVFLDFSGVEMVNGSWLNMAIAPLFQWAATSQHDLYPVIASFPDDWIDELELAAQVNAKCFPLVSDCESPIQSLRLVGSLDVTLQSTFRCLVELRSATGAKMAREATIAGVKPTTWNNRLRDLHDMRLVSRRREGRQQIYSPLAEEVLFNG